jgi:hypothetical protein
MSNSKQAKVTVETTHPEGGGFVHTLKFTNGTTLVHAVDPDHELYHQYAAHGDKAKILATANSAADTDDAVQKVLNLLEAFDNGKWSLLGDGGSKYTPLTLALAELKGISDAEADKIVKGLTKSQQAKLRGTERIATIIARIKGKDEGDDVLDSLLAPEADDASERVA